MPPRIRIIILATAGVYVAGLSDVSAQVSDSTTPSAESVIEGMRRERERIRSGVYSIAGGYSEEISHSKEFTGGDTLRTGKVDAFGAFDQRLVRFDLTVPSWMLPEAWIRNAARRARLDRIPADVTRIYSRGPDASCHYFSLVKRLEIWPPETVRPSSMRMAGTWMDVRALGLYNLDELFDGLDFNEICDKRFKEGDISVRREPDRQLVLSWMLGEKEKRQCWIDPERGFSPTRFIAQFKLPELGEKDWRQPHLDREIEWEMHAGSWVPRSYRDKCVKELPLKKPPEPPRYEYTPTYLVMQHVWSINWQSINEPVDGSLFDCDKFNLPDGTKIYERRSKWANLSDD